MIDNQTKWKQYIDSCDEKNLLDFDTGEIAYIDTDNTNPKPGEENHKFRPVIIIHGTDFKDAKLLTTSLNKNIRIEQERQNQKSHATTYFLPITSSHDDPPKISQEYDILLDDSVIKYNHQNVPPKQSYIKPLHIYDLNFEDACNMEDLGLNKFKSIGHINKLTMEKIFEASRHQIQKFEYQKTNENNKEKGITGFKSVENQYNAHTQKNPTVDYYNYKNPNSNLYNKPAHNKPKQQTNDLEL